MRNTLFLIILFLSFGETNAQSLDIYYNLHTDQVEYKKDGKVLKKPKLKKGGVVNIHLTEFNNYLYDVEMEVEQKNKKTAGGGIGGLNNMLGMAGISNMPGVSDMLSGLGLGASEETGGFGNMFGQSDSTGGLFSNFMDIPLISVGSNSLTLKKIFGKSRGAGQMMEQTNQAMLEVAAVTEEIQGIYNEMKKYEKAIIVSEFAEESLERLKLDPNIKPTTIRKMAGEFYEALFFKPAEAVEPSLQDILTWQEMPNKYASMHGQLGTKKTRLAQKTKNLQLLAGQLSGIEDEEEEGDGELDEYLTEAFTISKKATKLNNDLEVWLAASDPNAARKHAKSPAQVTDLQLKFAEILSNKFLWHSSVITSGDVIGIRIKLLYRPIGEKDAEPELIRTQTFEIATSGGLKISAGAGISFAQFSSPAQTFDVSDGKIVAEDAGVFSPSVTSLIHFYKNTAGGTTFGGSFGMGLPVLGGDEQSIQFYLGPSLHFGGSQKIILSGGVMTGKVTRLARGFQAGDDFDLNDGDIPVKSKYELGYFVGLSFGF